MPDPVSPEFERWAGELAVDSERAGRARRSWLVRQAAEEATLRGTLLDLAERGDDLVVTLLSGRRHHGTLRLVGDDLAGVVTPTGLAVLFPLAAIAVVQPAARRSEPVTGDREVRATGTLAATLSLLAEQSSDVLVEMAGSAEPVRGTVESVGADVLRVRTEGAGTVAHVPLAAVGALIVSDVILTVAPRGER